MSDVVDLARRAPQTWVMVGALALVHAASAAWIVRAGLGSPEAAWWGPRGDAALIACGARYAPAIARGEIWRLWTAPCLHGSLPHLLGNTLALAALGRLGEPLVGRRWAALVVAGAVGGGVVSHAAGVVRSVGASAGVQAAAWALVALAAVDARPTRGRLSRRARWALGPGLGALLLVDAAMAWRSPGVDLAAHAGGALVGVVAALAGAVRVEGRAG